MTKILKIRTLIVFISFLLSQLCAFSQQQAITVKSFKADENNLTATTNPVLDHNNQKCALIIVTNIGSGGYKFNAWNSFLKVEEKVMDGKSVYLLWVSDGTRRISITHNDSDIAPLENYTFNTPIKKAKTYYLEMGEILRSTKRSKQYLTFKVTPTFAGTTLEVDEIPLSLENGAASLLVDAGEHTYRVTAPEYNTSAGIVTTQKADGNKEVNIKLIPQFGWLNINGGSQMRDAEVFIDNLSVGRGDLTNYKLAKGTYTIKVVKPHHKLYKQQITISDGQTTAITPQLINNSSEVTIVSAKNAKIYIDGEYVGTERWVGPLEKGDYIVESKLANHNDVRQTISVYEINKKYTYNLKDHTPIFTSLSIESKPIGAKVYVDGKEMGKTPYHINEIITGQHRITVSMNGYDDYVGNVNLYENANNKVVAKLEDLTCELQINSTPSNSAVYINSKFVGATPHTCKYKKGTRINLELKSAGYQDFQKRVTVLKSARLDYNLQSLSKYNNLYTTDPYSTDPYSVSASPKARKKSKKVSCFIYGLSGDEVYVDGKYMGKVPYRYYGQPGESVLVEIKRDKTSIVKKFITMGNDIEVHSTR